jgi:PadR family transcriptional regulator PadR
MKNKLPLPRITLQSLKTLQAFMIEPTRELSGADIAKTASLMSGTLYPILIRFEKAGWLKSRWEDCDPIEAGRPKRRLYRITGAGQMAFHNSLSQVVPGILSWAH